MQHVMVVPYRDEWPSMFESEAMLISRILGDILVEVHHIGSTSVPGLCAKPIIDIMPVVTDISEVDSLNAGFESIGYECMGEFGIPGRRYFRKGGDDRTHQVHIFESDNVQDIERHLAVRDYLRTHPDDAKAYGELKVSLASVHPYDIDGYCDGKDAFVKALESKALEWYKGV